MQSKFVYTTFVVTAITAFMPTRANAWAEGLTISLSCGEAGIVTAIYKREIPGEYGSYYYADLKAPSLSLDAKNLRALATVQGIFEINDRGFLFISKGATIANPEKRYLFRIPGADFNCHPLK